MVEQAIRQTYTYYSPDHPQGKVIKDERLAGRGRAWVLGSYKHPVYPSPLNVRVGNAGIKVWMVINWLQLCNGDRQLLLERYGQVLEPGDIAAAVWYYHENQEAIDQRIAEEPEPA